MNTPYAASLPAGLPAGAQAPDEGAALALTRDGGLVDVLRRLAVAAGVALVVEERRPTRQAWTRAAMVLVGEDLADELAGLMPRRAGVVLVGLASGRGAAGGPEGGDWRRAAEVGAERAVLLPHSQEWVVQALAESLDGPSRCGVVGVVGGCGGAGASVLAAAVAVAAAVAGRRTLLADLDPLGGGIDLLVGAEGAPGLRWPELSRARGRVSGGMLREALPRVDGLSVLSWDRGEPAAVPIEAAASIAAGAVRGFDLVVADLPRFPDPLAQAWLRLVDVALLVMPGGVRPLAAASRVLASLDRSLPDLRAVVRGPLPPAMSAELVADTLGVPLFAELRPEPGLTASLRRSEPPGLRPRSPLSRCATRVLAAVDRLDRAA